MNTYTQQTSPSQHTHAYPRASGEVLTLTLNSPYGPVTLAQATALDRTTAVHELGNDPDTQVANTVAIMRQYIVEDSKDEGVYGAAVAALHEYGANDPTSAVFYYVKSRMRFKTDAEMTGKYVRQAPDQVVEVFVRPRDAALYWEGDCDDFVMLTAAMMLSLGVTVRIVTVAADVNRPGQFSHTYVAAYPKVGERVALDASHGQYPGWEVEKGVTRRQEWAVSESGEQKNSLGVLGAVAALYVSVWAWRLFSKSDRR